MVAITKHGHWTGNKASRTYDAWRCMKKRCYQPKNASFKSHGGRGIMVCDRWLNNFENFLADMGEAPAGLSLDRYPNNDGNYEPGNCRWATRKQQAQNRRSNKLDLEKVRIIRSSSETNTALALRFGVCQPVISQIRSGQLW